MAKAPAVADDAAAPADDDSGADTSDMGMDTADAGSDADDEGDQGTVLLTVCKEADGTYTLYQGDEDDDNATGDEGGSDDMAGAAAGEDQSQKFDSKGALLKGILDILNKDEAGAGGSDEDNFQAGFGGAADVGGAGAAGGAGATGGAAGAPLAQKY